MAGSYAPILFDAGYFDNPTLVVCPSSGLADRLDEWHMPTLLELENARGERLIVLQQNMGGSFAFTLGYIADGHYYPTRNLNRAYFVIMADAPIRDADGWRSNNHGGCGQNVNSRSLK